MLLKMLPKSGLILLLFVGALSTPSLLGQTTKQKTKTKAKTQQVYITNTGKKYHLSNCRFVAQSKIPKDKTTAVKEGFKPCDTCRPNKVAGATAEVQCSGKTQEGKRCKRKVSSGKYCHQHKS